MSINEILFLFLYWFLDFANRVKVINAAEEVKNVTIVKKLINSKVAPSKCISTSFCTDIRFNTESSRYHNSCPIAFNFPQSTDSFVDTQ